MTRFALATFALLAACNVDGPPLPAEPVESAPYDLANEVVDPELRDPPAVKVDTDVTLEPGLEVRPAIKHGRMAVIPIVTTATHVTQTEYLTLQDGMKRGLVSVREMPGEWEVDKVRVTNRSKQPLFVATGEIIVDAHQDRAMAEDTVITAGNTVEVEVRCIESDRDYGDNSFEPGNARAELSVRKQLLHGSQTLVWNEVDRINALRNIYASTKTYRHAAQRLLTDANARRDQLATQLAAHPERDRLVGFAVAVDGQVIAMERYASPSLYRQMEPSLVASVATHEDGPEIERGRVTLDAIRELANQPSAQTAASFTALKH